MRKKRRKSQIEVARAADMKQSAISRLEQDEYEAWSFKTLVRIAAVLEARPRFWLEPLEDVIQKHAAADASDRSLIFGASTADDVETESDNWATAPTLTPADTYDTAGYSSADSLKEARG